MSRRSHRTVMYRNAVTVALRLSSGPMTVAELLMHMPRTKRLYPTGCEQPCTNLAERSTPGEQHVECRAGHHVVALPAVRERIYAVLQGLERDGIVQRGFYDSGAHQVRWELTEHGRADHEIAELRRITGITGADVDPVETYDPSRRLDVDLLHFDPFEAGER